MRRLILIAKTFFFLLFLILPAGVGLGLEFYNRYYRGISTPFLYPALGLLCISTLFWTKRRWLYITLITLNVGFLIFVFQYILLRATPTRSLVAYYGSWALETPNGRLRLSDPLGAQAPSQGGYISCYFNLPDWKSYFGSQPQLCAGFNDKHQIKLHFLVQQANSAESLVVNAGLFELKAKSFWNESLDRGTLRLSYASKPEEKTRQLAKWEEIYEKKNETGSFQVLETRERNAAGELQRVTLSSSDNTAGSESYAVYDARGVLIEAPKKKDQPAFFPAQIDLGPYRSRPLPAMITEETRW